MLLSINEAKVAELLEASKGGYAVNGLDVPMVVGNTQPSPTAEAFGVVYNTSVEPQPKLEPAFGTHAREAVEIVKDWLDNK